MLVFEKFDVLAYVLTSSDRNDVTSRQGQNCRKYLHK